MLLLNYLRNGKLDKPFTELPREGPLPVIALQDVVNIFLFIEIAFNKQFCYIKTGVRP